MSASTRAIAAMLVVAVLAGAFWVLLLGPKRQEAGDLGSQVAQLRSSLAQAESAAAEAETARRAFPANYRQLVVLGKAVPAGDDTSSLLVELNHVADRANVRFESIALGTATGSASTEASAESPPTATPVPAGESSAATPAAALVPPTEAAAALQPIGATVGPAGLSVMPYDLTFTGSFFDVADFIEGMDSMIHTGGRNVAVDGRLVTLDGFTLNGDAEKGFPDLDATFSVTAYLAPPGQGVTAGATEAAPAESTAAASTTVASAR